jgi:MFS transporter, MHS family, proline/betaine transporter
MKKLTKELKKTVALLSIGTFLEYFDLMLYVHMATLLNGLYFEATNPHAVYLLSALGITLTFIFRPIGALIFGYIGDNFGRKPVMVLTTGMMALACFVMANLPTYAQIGFTASIIMTLCRVIQSLSSTGEVTSCKLYLMESMIPPIQYRIMGIVPLFAALGGTAALGIASIVTMEGFSWRYAFWIGTVIAIVGAYGRKELKDTSEFIDVQRKIEETAEKFDVKRNEAIKLLNINNPQPFTKFIKPVFALFFISCAFSIYYYFCYIYCGDLLKIKFNYSPEEVIHSNFILSIVDLLGIMFLMWITYYVNPLKILKIQLFISIIVVLSIPYLLDRVTEPYHLILIQYIVILAAVSGFPGYPIFYKYIPVLKRFKYAGVSYALAVASMFSITSFGLVYLIEWFGNVGLLILFVPVLTAYTISILYFDKLEKNIKTN